MTSRARLEYLTTAPDQITAEAWCELLRSQGIPATVMAGDTSSFMGVTAAPCRILVTADHLADARRLLEDELGPGSLK